MASAQTLIGTSLLSGTAKAVGGVRFRVQLSRLRESKFNIKSYHPIIVRHTADSIHVTLSTDNTDGEVALLAQQREATGIPQPYCTPGELSSPIEVNIHCLCRA